MSSSAYQSKALDLAHSTTPPLCQSGHRGCAGNGRQLLPLKVNNLMRGKVIEIDQKMMWGRGLRILIKSSWAHDINHPIVVLDNTSRVRWNWSSAASFEVERSNEGQRKKQVWSTNRCVLSTFFSTFNMDRRTDQQAYFPIEMQFYISVIFLGFPDKIRKERPSFLDFENN